MSFPALMLSVAYAQECPLIATGCSPSHANGVQTSSIFLLVMAKITSPGFAFFDLAYCSSDHRGVLVAALHEESLGDVEKGWRQKSPTAVMASLETRPTMDGEPER